MSLPLRTWRQSAGILGRTATTAALAGPPAFDEEADNWEVYRCVWKHTSRFMSHRGEEAQGDFDNGVEYQGSRFNGVTLRAGGATTL
ncbi:hypothetical protein HPB50_015047 [Hyalomma asiaticum]|uniref:Uncharacterized protein n=1 Tax=Hyalomma asiaticum TaxID=266040 RepID=A0ACB7SY76_HYAAI|nr:hypothetical protein HPB50_015047 [Hyalomma asiaticum]